jgi:hypothetical protein
LLLSVASCAPLFVGLPLLHSAVTAVPYGMFFGVKIRNDRFDIVTK